MEHRKYSPFDQVSLYRTFHHLLTHHYRHLTFWEGKCDDRTKWEMMSFPSGKEISKFSFGNTFTFFEHTYNTTVLAYDQQRIYIL